VSAPSGELDALLVEARAMSAKGRDTEAAQLVHSRVASLPAEFQGRARFEEARLYRRAKVPDLALPAAREALRLGQKDPDLLWIEADCMRQLEQSFRGGEVPRAARGRAEPHGRQAGLARIRMRSEDPVSALPLFDEYFRAASPLDDDAKIARLEHARALKIAGRYQQAADRYAELLEVEPLESVYYSGLAEVLYRLKLRKEARRVEGIYRLLSQGSFEEHVEERLRETGNTAFALGQRAANRLRQKRYLDAFRSYLQALELDQDEPRFRMFYADLATQFRRLPEARKVLEVALERKLQPASGLWWMLGRVALEEKRWIDAASAFQKGLEALSREGDAGGTEKGQASAFSLSLSLARAALESKDTGAARAAADLARKSAPSSWEPIFWQARAQLAEEHATEAARLFEEAAARGGRAASDLLDLQLYSALALEKLGRAPEAIARLEALRQAHSGSRLVLAELARLLAGDAARLPPIASALARIDEQEASVRTLEAALASRASRSLARSIWIWRKRTSRSRILARSTSSSSRPTCCPRTRRSAGSSSLACGRIRTFSCASGTCGGSLTSSPATRRAWGAWRRSTSVCTSGSMRPELSPKGCDRWMARQRGFGSVRRRSCSSAAAARHWRFWRMGWRGSPATPR
jgi:tetratricopeptide (TPR) repeat protein